MTYKFICPGCETEQPHAAALALHAEDCEAYQEFASYMDTCDYCSEFVTDEDAVDWCDRRGEHMHTECHSESGCLCRP